ncbi:hypothetical protein CHISP_1428 [Chitinispirillum alkaliphilum]|nr:hypothetical protein CHISP_1428 [Chitinispirillum alkaliphilum]
MNPIKLMKKKEIALRRLSPEFRKQVVLRVPCSALLGNHFHKGHFTRYDLFLRYLTIQSINNGENTYKEAYCRMQNLRTGCHDYQKVADLVQSFSQNGFSCNFPIPVTRFGMILDGAHRFASSLYFKIKEIPVIIKSPVKRVLYTREWFETNGFDNDILLQMDQIKERLFEENDVRKPTSTQPLHT